MKAKWLAKGIGILIFSIYFFSANSAWAIEVYLKNGDKISGDITGDDGITLTLKTVAAGEIKLKKAFVDLKKTFPGKYVPPKTVPPPPIVILHSVEWKKDLSLGYTQTGGNTKSQSSQFATTINRKTDINETTLKMNANYSSSNGAMSVKNFYGLGRYSYSFGRNLKWYNFYKMEGEQDYFEDIYYRLTPATGIGYWFSTTPDLKAMTELGIGYQYTRYRLPTTPNDGETVFVPRFSIDKRLIWNLHLTEDFTFYPSLEDHNDYRMRSETDLIHQITQRWALKISYVNEFNSEPPAGFKKDDDTWITSLVYHY